MSASARERSRGSAGQSQMLRKLGAMAARLVEELVSQGAKKIGVACGNALWETISALRKTNFADSRVYQIIGSSGNINPEIDGPSLARSMAEALGGLYFTIPAPLIVNSPATREALMKDATVSRIMQEASTIDMALVGIGAIDSETSTWTSSAHLAQEQLASMTTEGAVGEVCGIIFDRKGSLLQNPILNRVVGIVYEDLVRIPLKLGISAGEMKTLPILGACRAGLINCLVTDETSALGILEAFRQDW